MKEKEGGRRGGGEERVGEEGAEKGRGRREGGRKERREWLGEGW